MGGRTETADGMCELLAQVLELFYYPVWVCDEDGKVVFCNALGREYVNAGIIETLKNKEVEIDFTEICKEVISKGKPAEFYGLSFDNFLAGQKVNIRLIPVSDYVVISSEPADGSSELTIQKLNNERISHLTKLAARIAHELNNPLDGSIRYVNLAIRRLRKSLSEVNEVEKLTEYLLSAKQALDKMNDILVDISNFARTGQGHIESISINEMILQAITTLQAKIQMYRIDVITVLDENLPPVAGPKVYQVFCNLIKNSIDAIVERAKKQRDFPRRITITTRKEDVVVKIVVEDTGVGISDVERIFEPFFTTKEKSGGMGLGLAISKEIIEEYGGTIWAESLNNGAKFVIEFPIHTESNV